MYEVRLPIETFRDMSLPCISSAQPPLSARPIWFIRTRSPNPRTNHRLNPHLSPFLFLNTQLLWVDECDCEISAVTAQILVYEREGADVALRVGTFVRDVELVGVAPGVLMGVGVPEFISIHILTSRRYLTGMVHVGLGWLPRAVS